MKLDARFTRPNKWFDWSVWDEDQNLSWKWFYFMKPFKIQMFYWQIKLFPKYQAWKFKRMLNKSVKQ